MSTCPLQDFHIAACRRTGVNAVVPWTPMGPEPLQNVDASVRCGRAHLAQAPAMSAIVEPLEDLQMASLAAAAFATLVWSQSHPLLAAH